MLIHASITQIIIAAINKPNQIGIGNPNICPKKPAISDEFGNAHNAIAAIKAPIKRYGRRLPNLDFVLSLIAPIKG